MCGTCERLLVAAAVFSASALATLFVIFVFTAPRHTVPRTTGAVVIDCRVEQDLCSMLLSAGVVSAGVAEEE